MLLKSPSYNEIAAIDRDGAAGYPTGFVRSQIEDRADDRAAPGSRIVRS
jgi:hypothetical protein